MPYFTSQALEGHVPAILRVMPERLACSVIGLETDTLRALKTDSRNLPSLPTLEAICLRLLRFPSQVIRLRQNVQLRDIAPMWFDAGKKKPVIVIAGMGNLGHSLVGMLSLRNDVEVRALVSSEDRATVVRENIQKAGGVRVIRDGEADRFGMPVLITHDYEEALGEADLVIGTVPGHLHLSFMQQAIPKMRDGAYLACIPSAGGFNWKARKVLAETGKDIRIFGIGGVPWMCKLQGGSTVRISHAKKINALQPLFAADAQFVTDMTSLLLGMPMIDMGSFLNINLAPANQLLHPGILYAAYKDWDGAPFKEAPLFYEGLTREGAKILADMDAELLATARAIHAQAPDYWMSKSVSLLMGIRLGYARQIRNPLSLYSSIRTNRAYMGIRTPMTEVEGGLIPNFGSRFLTEDIPHGTAIFKGVAEIVGVETPTLDRVMTWCQEKLGKEYIVDNSLTGRDVSETAAPQTFGIRDVRVLVDSCVAS